MVSRLVNILHANGQQLGIFGFLFCLINKQNMHKKNRGKDLFPKSLPRISLIINIQRIIPPERPARRLTTTENQWVVSVSGNIWETFRTYMARSASMFLLQRYALIIIIFTSY